MSRIHRDEITVMSLAISVKLLLLWTNFSADFEAHRNSLAIIHSLPLEQWYSVRSGSPSKMNHAPLFAYFQWCLSQIAAWVDPEMLKPWNTKYVSKETILFQRCSVMLSDVVLFYAAHIWQDIAFPYTMNLPRLYQPMFLIGLLLNSGLFMMDHIRFQYNGLFIGIMLLAMARAFRGEILWSTFWFSVLLNLNVTYLYIAPPFFLYVFQRHVRWFNPHARNRVYRLAEISLIVFMVFLVSFSPFIYHGQMFKVIPRVLYTERRFPDPDFESGIWTFFRFADETVRHHLSRHGLIFEPWVSDILGRMLSLFVTAQLMEPSLQNLYNRSTPTGFLHSVVYCAWLSSMLGEHVQGNIILIPLLGLLSLAIPRPSFNGFFVAFSSTAHVYLFRLLPDAQERPIKIALALLYAWYMHHACIAHRGGRALAEQSAWMLVGLVAFVLCSEFVSGFFTPVFQKAALTATTVYCALGTLQTFLPFASTRLLW